MQLPPTSCIAAGLDDAGCCQMRALCITHAHRGVVQRRRADVVVVLIRVTVLLGSAAGFRALQCELMFAAAGPPGKFTAGSCSCWIFVWDVVQRKISNALIPRLLLFVVCPRLPRRC